MQMSKVQMLRSLMDQRLTAAVEEIFGLFESTITEYEDELCRSKQENERKQKLLNAAWNPKVLLNPAGIQQLLVVKEGVHLQQLEWNPSLDQEDPEPPHIKEEQEEVRIKQEGEHLQGLEEADREFPFTAVTVKNEEEEAQSSQLHQRQTEENKEEADGEDCRGSEPAGSFHPNRHLQTHTDDQADASSDIEDTDEHMAPNRESESDSNKKTKSPANTCSIRNNNDFTGSKTNLCTDIYTHESPHGSQAMVCSVCGTGFTAKSHLNNHMKIHTQENPHCCSVCGSRFSQKSDLGRHMRVYTDRKPFRCSVCKRGFKDKAHLNRHMTSHTGEKQFECLECGTRFAQKSDLFRHRRIHTGDKPFSCSECDALFTRKSNLHCHMRIHTREKPFSNSVSMSGLKDEVDDGSRMATYTGEKPFSCSECDALFARKSNLRRHMSVHTGEKPFCCAVCQRCFAHKRHVDRHMKIHTRQKRHNRADPADETEDSSDED